MYSKESKCFYSAHHKQTTKMRKPLGKEKLLVLTMNTNGKDLDFQLKLLHVKSKCNKQNKK